MSAPAVVLRERRRRLSELVGGRPVLLLGHGLVSRNFPANPYPWRQDSTFLYYLGRLEIGAAALVEAGGRTTLFLAPPDPAEALWHGAGQPREALVAAVGADGWRPRAELAPGPWLALPLQDRVANAEAARLTGLPLDPRDATTGSPELLRAVIAQRLRHDDHQVAALRRAAERTVRAHRAAMAATRPGVTEQQLHALIDASFAAAGMTSSYPSIVTARGEVLHGHATDHALRAGELLLVDAGAEEPGGHAADVTRTWPVSGRFEGRQRAVYDVVAEAERVAIASCVSGAEYRDLHLLAAGVLCRGMVDLGLLRGDVDSLVERGAHAVFFPHGVGHLLGLDVHDMEALGDAAGYGPGRARSDQFGLAFLRLDRTLEAGMAVTIEPGFYVVPGILADAGLRERLGDAVAWDAADGWRSFGGIRVEDDVLVTAGEPEILTGALEWAARDVEELVGSAPLPAALERS